MFDRLISYQTNFHGDKVVQDVKYGQDDSSDDSRHGKLFGCVSFFTGFIHLFREGDSKVVVVEIHILLS